MRLALLLPALLALLLLASGCAAEEKTGDIVTTIPWPDHERSQYVLLTRDGKDERGQGVLEATRDGATFELSLSFAGDGNTDKSVVTVDATTLKPISSRRVFTGSEEGTVTADYDATEQVVTVTENTSGEDRTVPLRLKDNYYDNDASIFLWRTIDFREGYKASYRGVVANQGAQPVITVRVLRKEEITVPAGTFQTWKLDISFNDRRQTAWYADTPEHPLVQYDNTLQLFQLTAIE